MGKTRCESCSKSCKGQVVKLQEKHYHTKCFKCKECKKELSPTAFYVRDNVLYCVDDYQKKFGVKCKACNKIVEGEVITALGFTYHISCLSCSDCKKNFDAGQNVTFIGDKHLCAHCVPKSSPTKAAPGSPTRSTLGQPNFASTPAKADESLDSSRKSANDVKSNGGPSLTTSNKAGLDDSVFDEPQPVAEESVSKTVSSQQNSMPTSTSAALSEDAPKYKPPEDKPLRRGELRFGQNMGHTSYLNKGGEFKKGPSQNVNTTRAEHFHRPVSTSGNSSFSYNNVRDDIAVTIGSARNDKIDGKDAVDAAKYPDAHRREKELPIERDDWPGPPLPAAAFPEIFRFRTQPHKSPRRNEDGVEVVDGEEEVEKIDPKTQREIDTLSKIPESGAAQSVLIEIAKQRAQGPMIDPRSASRTPNADHEPTLKTRYESPIFASPSRVLDSSARSHSQNELDSRHKLPPPSNTISLQPSYGSRGAVYSKEDVNGPSDGEHRGDRRSKTPDTESEVYDPVTGLRRGPRITLKSSSAAPAYLAYKGSMPDILKPSEEPPKVYPYEQLKLTNPQLPADVDRNSLERHLTKEEFESLFEMSQYNFYQLPEWKQNDMKRRIELY